MSLDVFQSEANISGNSVFDRFVYKAWLSFDTLLKLFRFLLHRVGEMLKEVAVQIMILQMEQMATQASVLVMMKKTWSLALEACQSRGTILKLPMFVLIRINTLDTEQEYLLLSMGCFLL